jgi:hypothetical protein
MHWIGVVILVLFIKQLTCNIPCTQWTTCSSSCCVVDCFKLPLVTLSKGKNFRLLSNIYPCFFLFITPNIAGIQGVYKYNVVTICRRCKRHQSNIFQFRREFTGFRLNLCYCYWIHSPYFYKIFHKNIHKI